MGPRLRAGLSGEKLQSLRRYLRDAGFWHSQAVETRNHELDSFESLESVPRTGLRLRGDDSREALGHQLQLPADRNVLRGLVLGDNQIESGALALPLTGNERRLR